MARVVHTPAGKGRAGVSGDSGIDLYQLASGGSAVDAVRGAQRAVASVALGQPDPESYARDVLAVLGIGVRV